MHTGRKYVRIAIVKDIDDKLINLSLKMKISYPTAAPRRGWDGIGVDTDRLMILTSLYKTCMTSGISNHIFCVIVGLFDRYVGAVYETDLQEVVNSCAYLVSICLSDNIAVGQRTKISDTIINIFDGLIITPSPIDLLEGKYLLSDARVYCSMLMLATSKYKYDALACVASYLSDINNMSVSYKLRYKYKEILPIVKDLMSTLNYLYETLGTSPILESLNMITVPSKVTITIGILNDPGTYQVSKPYVISVLRNTDLPILGGVNGIIKAYFIHNQGIVAIKKQRYNGSGLVELAIMSTYKHENIMPCRFAYVDADNLYIGMDYMLQSLDKVIYPDDNTRLDSWYDVVVYNKNKTWSISKAEIVSRDNVCLSLLSALSYLHDNSILHLDIKPANILVSGKGKAKIADFGASVILSSTKKKNCNVITCNYRPPELLTGTLLSQYKDYSYEVDIWSIGVVIFELVVGIIPFSWNSLGKDYTFEVNVLYSIYRVLSCSSLYCAERIKEIDQLLPDEETNDLACVDSLQYRNLLESIFISDPGSRPSASELLDNMLSNLANKT